MKIVSIEPTPSPNSMKINVSMELPAGESRNYKQNDDVETAPQYVKDLMNIEGVKGIYHVTDFIALERNARVSWEAILPVVRQTLGSVENSQELASKEEASDLSEEPYGEVNVYIQMFRGIPMQIKLEEGDAEHRVGLPQAFTDTAMKAAEAPDANLMFERKWVEQNPRFGSVESVGHDIAEELSASYSTQRLEDLLREALSEHEPGQKQDHSQHNNITLADFQQSDWKARYAALDRMDPTLNDLAVLDKALDDEKASVRRLATAYLGMIEDKQVLPYLYKALRDKSVTVRRTAGDCLSDLGYKEAMHEIITSLTDSNKIVRWRAAMFLYEVGDESALPALRKAMDEPEFEVRLQINMAIERIEGGEEAKGSVWHQMTQAAQHDN
ncbi:conserved virulence factor C family protein [Thalassobacillus sp. CUG 92003]|uniref:conserved virulence factor C family protein n=1 Tax=Thalassobacillus sp. CUG 92003 TaxID=2736641 RepID=UPI0015E63256|nr:conserved virulence factor C family protein [Thalassobacillus sp. CUG 92003]